MLQKESNKVFIDLYAFEERLTMDIDIEMANHFTSTWPESIFRLHRMCALPKPWGRVTLSDMELVIHGNGQRIAQILPPGPKYMAALFQHFGLKIVAVYEDLIPPKNS